MFKRQSHQLGKTAFFLYNNINFKLAAAFGATDCVLASSSLKTKGSFAILTLSVAVFLNVSDAVFLKDKEIFNRCPDSHKTTVLGTSLMYAFGKDSEGGIS